MDLLFDLIVECAVCLISDNEIDNLADPDRAKNMSKGMRAVVLTVSLLVLVVVEGFLLIAGIINLTQGELIPGLILTFLGAAVLVYCAVRFILTFKKKSKNQYSYMIRRYHHDRQNNSYRTKCRTYRSG